MTTGRLEAFSDGVIAIIITIMVLEMKVPHGDALKDLRPLLPVFPQLCSEFLIRRHLLEQPSSHAPYLHRGDGRNALGQLASAVLAVAISIYHRVDGAKPLHHGTHGAIRNRTVASRDRLLPAPAGDHPRARAGINPQEGSRPRLERQAVAAVVCPSNRCGVTFCVARARDPCDSCTDLADSGSAYRKTSCNLNG
jgi:hypothetical protein